MVEGTNNIFSYLPRANLENFRDKFTYSTNDCKLQRPVHNITGQRCTRQRVTTLWFETGAFQGTGGWVQQRLSSPRTVYTTDAPLETEEDTPVRIWIHRILTCLAPVASTVLASLPASGVGRRVGVAVPTHVF